MAGVLMMQRSTAPTWRCSGTEARASDVLQPCVAAGAATSGAAARSKLCWNIFLVMELKVVLK